MKAIEILEWIVKESIEGEIISVINVPEEGGEQGQQNEEWWNQMMGNCPPYPIEAGTYLFYYDSSYDCAIHYDGKTFVPDAQIEIPVHDGFDYIYLYKVEE